jgi:hypothetical protein
MKATAQLFDMSGKVAVVTDRSRGVGREMVPAFADAGFWSTRYTKTPRILRSMI